MRRQASLLVLAVAAGVLIGALGASPWSSDTPSSDASAETPAPPPIEQLRQDPSGEIDPERLADAVESLAEVLNSEITERRILTQKFEELQSELLDLKQNLRVRVQEAFQDGSRRQEQDDVDVRTPEERLAAAGFTRQQLESLDRLQVEIQMAQIELDDRARREGWINTPRYLEESDDLSTGRTVIRNALGDEMYDRYLFASGAPNRIAVTSVVETSPAQNAGFQNGDIVLRYAGENVYSSRQLVELRSSGQLGEPVRVEIRRNGELLELTMPRGPMGLFMTPMRVDPAEQ